MTLDEDVALLMNEAQDWEVKISTAAEVLQLKMQAIHLLTLILRNWNLEHQATSNVYALFFRLNC